MAGKVEAVSGRWHLQIPGIEALNAKGVAFILGIVFLLGLEIGMYLGLASALSRLHHTI